MIAVSREGDDIRLQKFRLSRRGAARGGAGTAVVEPKGEHTFKTANPSDDDLKNSVNFCGSVVFFLMPADLPANSLGFTIDEAYIFRTRGSDPGAELMERRTEVLDWIGDRAYENADGDCGLRAGRVRETRARFGSGDGLI